MKNGASSHMRCQRRGAAWFATAKLPPATAFTSSITTLQLCRQHTSTIYSAAAAGSTEQRGHSMPQRSRKQHTCLRGPADSVAGAMQLLSSECSKHTMCCTGTELQQSCMHCAVWYLQLTAALVVRAHLTLSSCQLVAARQQPVYCLTSYVISYANALPTITCQGDPNFLSIWSLIICSSAAAHCQDGLAMPGCLAMQSSGQQTADGSEAPTVLEACPFILACRAEYNMAGCAAEHGHAVQQHVAVLWQDQHARQHCAKERSSKSVATARKQQACGNCCVCSQHCMPGTPPVCTFPCPWHTSQLQ